MINAVLENKNRWNYSDSAPAKSGAGRSNPLSITAHSRASGFFMCEAQPHLHSMARCAGQPSGWPVSVVAGIATPVHLATQRRSNLGGEFLKLTAEVATMATAPILSHPEVTVENGRAVTTSVAVAEYFGKLHKNVIQKIESLDCSPEFTALNFKPSEYSDPTGRKLPCFKITKNGFIFLVMGFTGKKASAFKEDYIAEFDRMEDELRQPAPSSSTRQKICITLCGDKIIEVEKIEPDMYVGKIENILSGLRERGWIVIPRDTLVEKLAAL